MRLLNQLDLWTHSFLHRFGFRSWAGYHQMPLESVLSFPSSSRLFVFGSFLWLQYTRWQAVLSMHKIHKKNAENFTNTFARKCAIIVSVGALREISTPFYYTYIYIRKAAVHTEQPLFLAKNFLKKFYLKTIYTFFIIASAAAHRVASQAAAAAGVSPMAVM